MARRSSQLDRREFLRRMLHGASSFLSSAAILRENGTHADTPRPKPNFVFILMDDMGWKDLSCYGSEFYETPNIDKLAKEGVLFTNAYAACPVCSPTRASILTGKYPARLHLTDWIPGHKRPRAKLREPQFHQQLPLEEITIASALKPAGYVSASIGKWHLGGEDYYPEKHGFALNFGGTNQGLPPSYFWPYGIPNIESGQEGEYLTDRLTSEAITFIERNKDRPFFLYLSHYAVHIPLMAKKEVISKYENRATTEQKNPVYAAMIESVDQGVGRIVQRLKELSIADRTVIIFASDNGGLKEATSNAPLRAGEGTLYEGGLRVPLIVSWPGVVQSGQKCHIPVTSVDFFPTILRMARATTLPGHKLDGVNLSRILDGSGGMRRDAIYWHYPHYHIGGATPGGAIRYGDFKLIEFYEDNHVELYNLSEDIGERNDLAQKMPEHAEHLRNMLAEWREAVGAAMPTQNPDFDPSADVWEIGKASDNT